MYAYIQGVQPSSAWATAYGGCRAVIPPPPPRWTRPPTTGWRASCGASPTTCCGICSSGHEPDVILPVCVLRRLDAVLEPTKASVLEETQKLDATQLKEQDAALRAETGQTS